MNLSPSSLFYRLAVLLPGLGVFAYIWTITTVNSGPIGQPAFIQNPDALVRLERIRQFIHEGGWFERILTRVGAEDHLVLHWTRPLDVLVAAYTHVIDLFTTSQDPLLIAGTTLGLPIGLLSLGLAAQLPSILGERRPYLIGLAALFISWLVYFSHIFIATGWPDHHGLLIFLFVAAMLFGFRMIDAPTPLKAWGVGVILALGIWVSPEFLVATAVLYAGLGTVWAFDLRPGVARQALLAALSMSAATGLALVVEYGPAVPGLALDRLSYFNLLLCALLLALWWVLQAWEARLDTPLKRLGTGLGLAVVFGGLVLLFVPQAAGGPMAEADTWFVTVWTGVFRDGFNFDASGSLVLFGLAGASAVWLGYTQHTNRHGVLYLLPAFLIFTALGYVSSLRWVLYAEICAMPFILAGYGRLWNVMKNREAGIWVVARSLSVLIVILPPAASAIVALKKYPGSAPEDTSPWAETARLDCNPNGAVAKLREIENRTGPQLILAHANETPVFLYFTGHRVQAVPIHPDAEAVHDSVRFLLSTGPFDPGATDASLLVLCPAGHEFTAYQDNPQSLHARLSRGEDLPGISLVFDSSPERVYDKGHIDFKIFALHR